MNVDDKYGRMFRDADKDPEYWLAVPATEFIEDVGRRMRAQRVSRSELARRLGTTRAYVTKLLQGGSNFGLLTMVKVALALGGVLHTHISDRDVVPRWVGFTVSRDSHGTVSRFISAPPQREFVEASNESVAVG